MTTTTTIPNIEVTYSTEPRDLHTLRPWFNVIRRLRAAALASGPYSAIRIVVVASGDGQPLNWTSPKVTAIEPKADTQTLDTLLNVLTE